MSKISVFTKALVIGVILGIVIGLVSGYTFRPKGIDVTALEEQISDLENQVGTLQAQIEEKDATISSLEPKISELEKLRNQIEEKDTQIANLESQVKKYRQELQTKISQLSEIQDKLSEIEGLEVQIAEKDTQIANLQAQIQELEAEIEESKKLAYDELSDWTIILQPGDRWEFSLEQEKEGGNHDIFASIKGYEGKLLLEYPVVYVIVIREEDGLILREKRVYETGFGVGPLPVGMYKIVIDNRDTKKEAIVELTIISYT